MKVQLRALLFLVSWYFLMQTICKEVADAWLSSGPSRNQDWKNQTLQKRGGWLSIGAGVSGLQISCIWHPTKTPWSGMCCGRISNHLLVAQMSRMWRFGRFSTFDLPSRGDKNQSLQKGIGWKDHHERLHDEREHDFFLDVYIYIRTLYMYIHIYIYTWQYLSNLILFMEFLASLSLSPSFPIELDLYTSPAFCHGTTKFFQGYSPTNDHLEGGRLRPVFI